MLSLSADADEAMCRLAATFRRVAQEREQAFMQRDALFAELQARRNAQAMMAALASGSPFGCHSNRAFLVPFGGRMMTMQEQYYARAAGASYCFASSLSRTSGQDSFDPDMFLVDAAEGDSAVPATATGSGAPGVAGKRKSSGSELGLVAEQMLRVPRKRGEVVEAPVRNDDEDAGTSVEEAPADSESTEDAGSVDDENCSRG